FSRLQISFRASVRFYQPPPRSEERPGYAISGFRLRKEVLTLGKATSRGEEGTGQFLAPLPGRKRISFWRRCRRGRETIVESKFVVP
nr:hypothetical protein [Tanacetum cinerariifolium]